MTSSLPPLIEPDERIYRIRLSELVWSHRFKPPLGRASSLP